MNEISETKLREMEDYCLSAIKPPVFIVSGDHITGEVTAFLRELKERTNAGIVSSCFQASAENASHTKDYCFFYVDQKCRVCGKIIQTQMSKSVLRTKLLSQKEPEYICSECSEREDEARKKLSEISSKKWLEEFLEEYCEPREDYKAEGKPASLYYSLKNQCFGDFNEAAKKHLKELTYENFLKTPYWKIIASYAKHKAKYRCSLCNSTGTLNVHHRVYTNHGSEVYHLEDLIVLCDKCHMEYHERKSAGK